MAYHFRRHGNFAVVILLLVHVALDTCFVSGKCRFCTCHMRKSVHNTRVTVPRKAVLQELMLADFENVPLLSLEDHQLLHMMPVGDGASETRSAPEYVKLMQNVIIPWVKQDMPKENTIEAVKRELMKQCHEFAWVNPEKVSIVTQRRTLSRLIAFCSCCGTCDGEEWQRHMVRFTNLQEIPTDTFTGKHQWTARNRL